MIVSAATAATAPIAGVVIRKITPVDLDCKVVEGPMPYNDARRRVTELNTKPVDGSLFVIAAE